MRVLATTTLALAALMALPQPAAAQADPCAGRLDPLRIVECLRPGGISGAARGIRPAATPPQAVSNRTQGAVATPAAPPPVAAGIRNAPPVSAVDLSVPFAFDSAELTPQVRDQLGALATALKDPALAGTRFRIAGHTDAQGADDYNQALSERRAEAARRFLVDQGVEAARLTAMGFGRRELYDAANPTAATNRRVQVVRVEN
jgi:outer membrane protein OmpA-like peptidoglycan-associated protein